MSVSMNQVRSWRKERGFQFTLTSMEEKRCFIMAPLVRKRKTKSKMSKKVTQYYASLENINSRNEKKIMSRIPSKVISLTEGQSFYDRGALFFLLLRDVDVTDSHVPLASLPSALI